MGWETRRGRSYYYRKERGADGRVRSVYVGPAGELLAQLYAEQAEDDRRVAAARARILGRTLTPIDAALSALDAALSGLHTLATAYALATGHHQHKGQWRRRRSLPLDPFSLSAPDGAPPMPRKKKPTEPIPPGATLGGLEGVSLTVPDVDERLRRRLAEDIEQANTGKKATPEQITRLRETLLRFPAEAFTGSTSARMALRKAAEITTGGGSGTSFVEADTLRFAAELAEPDDGPLVRAACEAAALARLVHEQATTVYGRTIQGEYRFVTAEHLERRMTATHTRYLRTLATLSRLREMERKERRRAERHAAQAERQESLGGLQRAAAAQSLLDKLTRLREAQKPALPLRAGDSLPSPEEVELVEA